MKFSGCPVNRYFSGIIQYTFIFAALILTTFSTSFWKRVHNSKEIVNIQGLFVATVGYVDMTTYPLTKYYHRDISPWNYYTIESVYFIYRLFILFISTLSLLLILYTVSWRYKRDYLHTGIDVLFYVMFCIINTMKKR